MARKTRLVFFGSGAAYLGFVAKADAGTGVDGPGAFPTYSTSGVVNVGQARTVVTRFTIASEMFEEPEFTTVEGLRVGDTFVLNVPVVVTTGWTVTIPPINTVPPLIFPFVYIGEGTLANPPATGWRFRVDFNAADTSNGFTAVPHSAPGRLFARIVSGNSYKRMHDNTVESVTPRYTVTERPA